MPFLSCFSDHSFRWILVRSFRFADFRLDVVLLQLCLEFGVLPDLFLGAIADQCFHSTMFVHKAIQWFVSVCLPLDGMRRCEEMFVGKHLAELLALDGPASHVHSIRRESPLKPVH
jgi:hypothetical protein